ncbi:hypothetical protein RIF29_27398 [Crotalaria pallida]|uniref:Uncharacterized protein n=1 Tax=Crotalaria pallida TaxID=3830 RepID=A0AAN9EPY4_CROPI
MNRRTRSTLPSSITPPNPHFHKYLKPGTLARIRDSRITARSNRFNHDHHLFFFSQIPLRRRTPTPPSSPPPHHHPIDVSSAAIPFFASFPGPRFLQRKKLMAAKSIYFLPPSPVIESPDLIVTDSFGTDILVAN